METVDLSLQSIHRHLKLTNVLTRTCSTVHATREIHLQLPQPISFLIARTLKATDLLLLNGDTRLQRCNRRLVLLNDALGVEEIGPGSVTLLGQPSHVGSQQLGQLTRTLTLFQLLAK